MRTRTAISPAQAADLETVLAQREHAIVRNALQRPDYPPLPACPGCGQPPTRIARSVGADTVYDFAPCGHGFRLDFPAP